VAGGNPYDVAYTFKETWLADYHTPVPTATPISIKQLGYEWIRTGKPRGESCLGCTSELYRNGKVLFKNVGRVSKVNTLLTSSGQPIHTFIVDTAGGSFLIQNNDIFVTEYNSQYDYNELFHPFLYQDEPLWITTNANYAPLHGEVRTSTRRVISSFLTYPDRGTESLPTGIKRFGSWRDHWILNFNSFLIQDGENVNKKLGFGEIFGWTLVNDKPVYFFRKGARFGVSYDGQALPLQYEDIPHDLCCDRGTVPTPARNNPLLLGNFARFYGKRDGVWYYVLVQFK
jgi:hypothetical protein